MLYKILWSPEAVSDMDKLYSFYAQHSVQAASRIYNGIMDDVIRLTFNPSIAQIEVLLNARTKTYRSLVVSKGRFKIIYFVERNIVYITHVWSCRRNPQDLHL